MIFISHRGNITGKISNLENTQEYIVAALEKGYNAEIDIWYQKEKFYLGHDSPGEIIEIDFLKNKKLWCHAKNIDAVYELGALGDIHYFWHQKDDIALTSLNYIWTYPGKHLTKKSICVLPEYASYNNKDLRISAGICSDEIGKYKNEFEAKR